MSGSTERLEVDLIWLLWSNKRPIWDDRRPGSWVRVRRAWMGSAPPVLVESWPNHYPGRHMAVLVKKGRMEMRCGNATATLTGMGFGEAMKALYDLDRELYPRG